MILTRGSHELRHRAIELVARRDLRLVVVKAARRLAMIRSQALPIPEITATMTCLLSYDGLIIEYVAVSPSTLDGPVAGQRYRMLPTGQISYVICFSA